MESEINANYHYNDVTMYAMASQITSPKVVYSFIQGADQRKHQSSASLAFVRGIHRSPVNSPHKGPVAQKMFPFDDVIMMNPWYLMKFSSTLGWVSVPIRWDRTMSLGKYTCSCSIDVKANPTFVYNGVLNVYWRTVQFSKYLIRC